MSKKTTPQLKKVDQDRKQVKETKQQAQTQGEPTGRLDKLLISLESKKSKLRGKGVGLSLKRFQPEREILSALSFLSTIVINVIAFRDLPKTLKAIVQNPSKLKAIPSAIKGSIIDFGKLVKVSPSEAIVRVGTEIFLLKGTGKVFSSAGKLTGKATARLSTKFVGSAKVGTSLKITTKAGRKVSLKVVGKIGGKGLKRETISQQVSRAEKRFTGVSTQADELVKIIRRKKIVRKPLGTTKAGKPIEEALSKTGKKLLNKLDNGRITPKEIVQLDKLIKQKGGGGILERSFFVDPEARVRPSRLGIQQEASITDIFSRDFTFRKQKPQILVFDKIQVQKFPKDFKTIISKLRNKKTLTRLEADKLLQFQLKKSGKFKPLGFISGESELTLAPGEIIKRVKKIGVTIINGKKVPIIEAKVIKTSGRFNSLLKKFQRGVKLTAKEKRELNRLLKKQTGFKGGISSKKISTKRVSIRKLGAKGLSRGVRRSKRIKRISKVSRIKKGSRKARPKRVSRKPRRSKRPTKRRPPKRPIKRRPPGRPGKRPIKRRPPKRPGRRGSSGRSGRPPGKPTPPIFSTKKFKKKILSKKVPVFLVKIRRKGKIVNLVNKPLRLNHAKDYLAYSLDHNLVRSGWFFPLGKSKKVVTPNKNVLGYFNKVKHKLRPYKIKDKRKKRILNGYIETRKFLLDKKRERIQLKASKKRKVKRVVRKGKRRNGSQKRNGNRKGLSPMQRRKQNLINKNKGLRKQIKKRVKRRPIKKRRIVRRKVRRKPIRRKVKRRVKRGVVRKRLSIMQRRKQKLIQQNARLRRLVRRKPIRRKKSKRKIIKRRKRK